MYVAVSESCVSEENGLGTYQTCAIVAPSGHVVHDVTTQMERLEGFVACLNELGASEVHLMELIDDFIG